MKIHSALPLCLLIAPVLSAQTNPEALELGKTVRAELAGGQSHRYAITASDGQFMRIVFSRPGFGILIRLSEAAAKENLLELQWPAGAQGRLEPFYWIAKASGEYRIELVAAEQAA
jgi:hypothetical protein